MEFYIGIDVGSSSVRGGLFNDRGSLLSHAKRNIKVWNPEPDFYEHSSTDIWNCVTAVILELKRFLRTSERITGIGFDATCSLVVLDRKTLRGKSVSSSGDLERDVIMWMDHRAHEETAMVNATRHKLLNFVGGSVSIEMQIPKILWLKKHFGEDYLRTSYFFDLADFLTFKCTGNTARSLNTVTCKWLFDGESGSFDADLFRSLGLGALSEHDWAAVGASFVGPGSALEPGLSAEAAQHLGLQTGCPVASGLLDAYAGVLGALFCREEGEDVDPESRLVLIAGTSACHLLVNNSCVFVEGVWGPFLSALMPHQWMLEGGQSAVASLLDHVTSLFPCPTSVSEIVIELEKMRVARGLADVALLTEEVHMVPDFHGNRSPLADPEMRGMISGLRLDSSVQEGCVLYLAAVQALAYGTRHIFEYIQHARGSPIRAVVLCGGLRHNALYVRNHVDILGVPFLLPNMEESVLLGAAMLGNMAANAEASMQDVAMAMAGHGVATRPNEKLRRYHEKKFAVFKELIKCQQKAIAIMKS